MDNKSRPRHRKVFYIAPLITAGALALVVAVVVWRQNSAPPVAKAPPEVPAPAFPPVKVSPPLSLIPPPLARAELVSYAERASDAYAATGHVPPGSPSLTGRHFSLRLPFGCNGPNGVALNPQTMVSYDAARNSLTLTAQPGLWASLPVMQPLVDAGKAEAVEGFWLPRPWTSSEACPPPSSAPPPAIATPPSAQTLGLAQIFAPGSARTQRHGEHPYSFTRKLEPADAATLDHSYHLLLEGTISGYPDGQPLHCSSEAADHRPICIYAVTLDRVAFEDAATGAILASWTD